MSLFLKNLPKSFFRAVVSSRPIFNKATSLFSSITANAHPRYPVCSTGRLHARSIFYSSNEDKRKHKKYHVYERCYSKKPKKSKKAASAPVNCEVKDSTTVCTITCKNSGGDCKKETPKKKCEENKILQVPNPKLKIIPKKPKPEQKKTRPTAAELTGTWVSKSCAKFDFSSSCKPKKDACSKPVKLGCDEVHTPEVKKDASKSLLQKKVCSKVESQETIDEETKAEACKVKKPKVCEKPVEPCKDVEKPKECEKTEDAKPDQSPILQCIEKCKSHKKEKKKKPTSKTAKQASPKGKKDSGKPKTSEPCKSCTKKKDKKDKKKVTVPVKKPYSPKQDKKSKTKKSADSTKQPKPEVTPKLLITAYIEPQVQSVDQKCQQLIAKLKHDLSCSKKCGELPKDTVCTKKSKSEPTVKKECQSLRATKSAECKIDLAPKHCENKETKKETCKKEKKPPSCKIKTDCKEKNVCKKDKKKSKPACKSASPKEDPKKKKKACSKDTVKPTKKAPSCKSKVSKTCKKKAPSCEAKQKSTTSLCSKPKESTKHTTSQCSKPNQKETKKEPSKTKTPSCDKQKSPKPKLSCEQKCQTKKPKIKVDVDLEKTKIEAICASAANKKPKEVVVDICEPPDQSPIMQCIALCEKRRKADNPQVGKGIPPRDKKACTSDPKIYKKLVEFYEDRCKKSEAKEEIKMFVPCKYEEIKPGIRKDGMVEFGLSEKKVRRGSYSCPQLKSREEAASDSLKIEEQRLRVEQKNHQILTTVKNKKQEDVRTEEETTGVFSFVKTIIRYFERSQEPELKKIDTKKDTHVKMVKNFIPLHHSSPNLTITKEETRRNDETRRKAKKSPVLVRSKTKTKFATSVSYGRTSPEMKKLKKLVKEEMCTYKRKTKESKIYSKITALSLDEQNFKKFEEKDVFANFSRETKPKTEEKKNDGVWSYFWNLEEPCNSSTRSKSLEYMLPISMLSPSDNKRVLRQKHTDSCDKIDDEIKVFAPCRYEKIKPGIRKPDDDDKKCVKEPNPKCPKFKFPACEEKCEEEEFEECKEELDGIKVFVPAGTEKIKSGIRKPETEEKFEDCQTEPKKLVSCKPPKKKELTKTCPKREEASCEEEKQQCKNVTPCRYEDIKTRIPYLKQSCEKPTSQMDDKERELVLSEAVNTSIVISNFVESDQMSKSRCVTSPKLDTPLPKVQEQSKELTKGSVKFLASIYDAMFSGKKKPEKTASTSSVKKAKKSKTEVKKSKTDVKKSKTDVKKSKPEKKSKTDLKKISLIFGSGKCKIDLNPKECDKPKTKKASKEEKTSCQNNQKKDTKPKCKSETKLQCKCDEKKSEKLVRCKSEEKTKCQDVETETKLVSCQNKEKQECSPLVRKISKPFLKPQPPCKYLNFGGKKEVCGKLVTRKDVSKDKSKSKCNVMKDKPKRPKIVCKTLSKEKTKKDCSDKKDLKRLTTCRRPGETNQKECKPSGSKIKTRMKHIITCGSGGACKHHKNEDPCEKPKTKPKKAKSATVPPKVPTGKKIRKSQSCGAKIDMSKLYKKGNTPVKIQKKPKGVVPQTMTPCDAKRGKKKIKPCSEKESEGQDQSPIMQCIALCRQKKEKKVVPKSKKVCERDPRVQRLLDCTKEEKVKTIDPCGETKKEKVCKSKVEPCKKEKKEDCRKIEPCKKAEKQDCRKIEPCKEEKKEDSCEETINEFAPCRYEEIKSGIRSRENESTKDPETVLPDKCKCPKFPYVCPQQQTKEPKCDKPKRRVVSCQALKQKCDKKEEPPCEKKKPKCDKPNKRLVSCQAPKQKCDKKEEPPCEKQKPKCNEEKKVVEKCGKKEEKIKEFAPCRYEEIKSGIRSPENESTKDPDTVLPDKCKCPKFPFVCPKECEETKKDCGEKKKKRVVSCQALKQKKCDKKEEKKEEIKMFVPCRHEEIKSGIRKPGSKTEEKKCEGESSPKKEDAATKKQPVFTCKPRKSRDSCNKKEETKKKECKKQPVFSCKPKATSSCKKEEKCKKPEKKKPTFLCKPRKREKSSKKKEQKKKEFVPCRYEDIKPGVRKPEEQDKKECEDEIKVFVPCRNEEIKPMTRIQKEEQNQKEEKDCEDEIKAFVPCRNEEIKPMTRIPKKEEDQKEEKDCKDEIKMFVPCQNEEIKPGIRTPDYKKKGDKNKCEE